MFISITRWLLLFTFLLVISSCARDRVDPQLQALLDKPNWVMGESSKYQEQLYFLGHGVSANLDVAKTQSMDDLTDAYNAHLQGYVQDLVSTGAHSATERKSLLNVQTQLFNERIVHNRQISEVWRDPSSKAYHVLSVIDRVKVAADLVEDIYHFDNQIQRVVDRSGQEADPLQRIAIANIAIEKYHERQRLITAAGVLNPESVSSLNLWSKEKIQSQISRWLSDVKIMPVLNPNDPKLLNALAGGVSKAGFIVDYGANPHYVLKVSFQQGQVKWNDGVYSLEGDLHLELWDGQTKGQVRGKTHWPIHVSATERSRLPLEVAAAIEKVNEDKLRSAILEFEDE